MKLFDHQSAVISEDPKKTGLWFGTGSGKTRIALSLARGKTLVICPKTQKLDQNWERECDKMRKAEITLKMTDPYPHVVSKEEFRRDHKDMKESYNTIIVDEAETCLGVTPNICWRNKKPKPKASQLYDALRYYIIGRKVPLDRLYLCTATITRTPMTVWAAATILGKKWNWYKWRDTFYTKLPIPRREVWVPKKTEECKDRLAKAVREIGFVGRLEDWFDVPEQFYKNDYIELTPIQTKRIKELKIEYPDPIVSVIKRLQVENGTLKGDEFNKEETFKTRKMDRILHYAEEFPRLIIWARFTNQIKQIENVLNKKGYKVYTLTGATKDRKDLFHTLSKKNAAILIAQTKISSGWEWNKCPVMLFASREYGIAEYIQATGRIQRTDAIKTNIYINLITKGGVDEAVHESLINKKDFSERVYAKL